MTTPRRMWTDEEVQLLREKWPVSFAVDLEELFGRSADRLNYKARCLGLTKAESFKPYNRYGRYTKKGNHFDTHVH